MVLPNGWAQMSPAVQLLVLANLERGDRGLAEFAGLSPTLDAASASGASANTDPSPPAGYPFSQWGSNWAGALSPLESDFLWMYDDGVGGTNADCQPQNMSGCWGHRNNILGPWTSNGSQSATMGDAATSSGAYTELFVNKTGTPDSLIDPYSSISYPAQVAPEVVAVTPGTAPSPGTASKVTIEGNYFGAFENGATPSVHFGSGTATNVHVISDGALSVTPPLDPNGAHAATVVVTVTTAAGTSDATPNETTNEFTYSAAPVPSVASVSANTGPLGGGSVVTIAGSGLASASGVTFGGVPATSFSVNSASSITAVVPASTKIGAVDVVVSTIAGPSATTSSDHFTYKAASSVAASVSSTTPVQGSSVTYNASVSGAGGTPSGTVTFTDGAITLCAANLVSGLGSCQSTTAPPGSSTVSATYSGDATFAPSSGSIGLIVTSGDYTPLSPTRICDTRANNPSSLTGTAGQCSSANGADNAIAAGGTETIHVAGSFNVTADATAVVLNVTSVASNAPGFFTVFPAGAPLPNASNLNYVSGEVVPNLIEVGLGTGGEVSIYSSAQSDAVVDVEGFVHPPAGDAPSGLYNPLPSPVRICDTRAGDPSGLTGANAQCLGERISGGGAIAVQVAGINGVPNTASAVVLNVTDVNPTAAGFLTVFPEGGAQPTASNLNFGAGQVTANRVIVPLSAGTSPGQISIFSSTDTDVVVDISGYYSSAGGSGSTFTTEPAPARICDTRAGVATLATGPNQCDAKSIGPGGALTIQVAGIAGVPSDATAVVVNLTAVAPSGATYLTVYPGPTRSFASDLNPATGEVRANLTLATLNANGSIDVYNNTGSVNVVVDVLGWYS